MARVGIGVAGRLVVGTVTRIRFWGGGAWALVRRKIGYQNSAEEAGEQSGNGSKEGKDRPQETISNGQGVYAGLGGGDEKGGGCPSTGAVVAEPDAGRYDPAGTKGQRNSQQSSLDNGPP